MRKILIAIDFSEGTESICKYSIEFAKKYNAEIRLFHSYFDKILISESNYPSGIEADTMINRKVLDDIKEQAGADLKELGSCIHAQYPDVKISYSLRGGNPEDEIINETDEYLPDLIIMGSSGKGRKGIISGSTSRKIMCNAEIPVLAIPLGSEYQAFENILYLTEFDEKDTEIINKLTEIFSEYSVRIHCVHILLKGNDQNEKMKELEKKLSIKEKNGSVICNLIEGKHINEDIEKYILEHQINAIAFLSHKRSFFSEIFTHKITKKDLFQINLPLLAFKA